MGLTEGRLYIIKIRNNKFCKRIIQCVSSFVYPAMKYNSVLCYVEDSKDCGNVIF